MSVVHAPRQLSALVAVASILITFVGCARRSDEGARAEDTAVAPMAEEDVPRYRELAEAASETIDQPSALEMRSPPRDPEADAAAMDFARRAALEAYSAAADASARAAVAAMAEEDSPRYRELEESATAAIEQPPGLEMRSPPRHPEADVAAMDFAERGVLEAYIAAADTSAHAADASPPPPTVLAPASAARTHAPANDHLSHLPAGAKRGDQGFATVQVFYATDRQRGPLPLSDYQITGQNRMFVMSCVGAVLLVLFAVFCAIRGRSTTAALAGVMGLLVAVGGTFLVVAGRANIEKHGVTYNGDRGTLVRGICEVTVPDIHQRGIVERPSLLRFEFREDQQEHIVLTSAVELIETDFQRRLAETISSSPDRDLLVFIHGYNVDFQSAVCRTAQVAVDLPFEGVPVCYSWPSQGSLFGYSVDETNAEWTIAHLKQFLMELATESGAHSINVVAHSMGNRPMTAALQEIGWQLDDDSDAPFNGVVLAAPDVDADRFRRDLAPSLLRVAEQVTLYASSDDQALIASKKVHGYPRAGESGANIVVVPGVETIDVSGIDLSLLGHSYYGDNESMLRDLYDVVRRNLPAPRRSGLVAQRYGEFIYWQLAQRPSVIPSRR